MQDSSSGCGFISWRSSVVRDRRLGGSLRTEVFKDPEGSYSIALKALRCCYTVSCKRRSSLPLPSFECRGFEDHANMGLMNETWTITTRL